MGVDTRLNFWCLQGTRSRPISFEVSQRDYAYWLFRLFSRHISRTQSFQENRPFNFQARVVLKPLVSLTDRRVACSSRISVDTHTYCNPRCACAPRVNEQVHFIIGKQTVILTDTYRNTQWTHGVKSSQIFRIRAASAGPWCRSPLGGGTRRCGSSGLR